LARRRVPKPVFDYIDGAACDEVTARRNRADFEAISLPPEHAGGSCRGRNRLHDLDGTVRLDLPSSDPRPGLAGLANHRGEQAIAAAALPARRDLRVVLRGSYSVEEIAPHAPGALWKQVYLARDRA